MKQFLSPRALLFLLSLAVLFNGVLPISAADNNNPTSLTLTDSPTTKGISMSPFTYSFGGIIRGPRNEKKIALIFTGGSFAEGGTTILDELKKHNAKASFFFTGDFFRIPEFQPLIHRVVAEGHYLGPHSDKHLLYAPWEDRNKTLVTEQEFRSDLEACLKQVETAGMPRAAVKYWIPPYEWYNYEISAWSRKAGLVLFNFTPGTRANADWAPDDHKSFLPSQKIYDSILEYEQKDPDGLNGFLLLLHIGAGPERTDKMHKFFGPLLTELEKRGYRFVRVDEMLRGAEKEAQK
ncbi:MAG: polysaccharide deacetylase family protein [bacterium]